MAITMHGGGLGFGLLDSAGGSMMINQEGKIEIAFGFEECGQGLLAVIENIVVEEIGCSPADIQIVIGDTNRVPSTGSSTASRSTSMVWHAVKRMKNSFCGKVCKAASSILNVPEEKLFLGESGVWQEGVDFPVLTYKECIQGLEETDCIKVHTKFHFPTTPDAVLGSHFLYVFAGVTVDVDVDLLTGKVKVMDVNHVVAAGPVVSPIGYRGQIEGGGIMSLGYALMENVKMVNGKYMTENLDTYLMPSIADVPFDMNVQAIEELYEADEYGPRGVGEIGLICLAPAIANAVHDAIGHHVNRLPISPEEILKAIEKRGLLEWI